MNTYQVTLIAESMTCPFTKENIPEAKQELAIQADSIRNAVSQSRYKMTLKLRGQVLKTFVNGVEYFNERY